MSHSTQPEKITLKISPSSHHHPITQFPNPSKPWPDQGLWPCHGLQIFQVRLELPRPEGLGCHIAELLLLGQGLREARQRPKFVDLQGQLDVLLTTSNGKQFHQGVARSVKELFPVENVQMQAGPNITKWPRSQLLSAMFEMCLCVISSLPLWAQRNLFAGPVLS